MKTQVVTAEAALIELEIRPTKEMTNLDVLTLAQLRAYAQAQVTMRCTLLLRDGHLTLVLDQPSL